MRIALLRAFRPATSLWMLMLLALALRVVVVALTSGAGYDIMSYAIQAQSVLTHHNIYAFTDRYPYPPVWVWLVALAQWVANSTGLSFDGLVRFPGMVGDVGIVALLYRRKGNLAALFYAANPVAILITAGHGQFDGLVMALVVAAWALWENERRHMAWAALALGGAIALKGYPVLLLPGLLIGAESHQRRALLIGLAFTPLLVSMLVYSAFFGLEPAMITHVLGYQSPAIFGWGLYLNKPFPQLALLLGGPARVAVLLFPVLLALRKPHWPLASHWLATFLGFYVLAPGLSPQYLLWVLPLLAAVDLNKGLLYTAFATLALMVAYLKNFPSAVPGGPELAAAIPADVLYVGQRVVNLIWLLACLWLLWSMFLRTPHKTWRAEQPLLAAPPRLSANRLAARDGGAASGDADLAVFKETAPDRRESSDSSRPESANQPETDENRAESQPDSNSHIP
ncbi:MAG TPA: glycosyltransferase 87 family protein [Ktedonobacterales bacterium]|nr:glycosyltransferase 87 family protein [Ktedonobacterales bacterium]